METSRISHLRANSGQIYDYIIVGSGPGGGPLAANLARAGYTVALLEYGIDIDDAESIDSTTVATYSTPSSFGACSEHQFLSWDMFVKHYKDEVQSVQNNKWVDGKGMLYPRGSALGGSAAHNALVWVYPHDDDFDSIVALTGDESWNSKAMRAYFRRLERCEYLPKGAPGHGFDGYISSSTFDPQMLDLASDWKDIAFADDQVPPSYYEGNEARDVNHPAVAAGEMGTYITPMHASKHTGQTTRSTAREYLLETQREHPDRLFILTGALATRVLTHNQIAFGVEFLAGAGLYKADKKFDAAAAAETMAVYARNEVILSGGAFNTPQLLKLSGIGPADELKQFGIEVVKDLPGVGTNLQDRYEVYVTSKTREPLGVVKFCKPGDPGDPCATAYGSGNWVEPTQTPFHGPYATNLICATRITKSSRARRLPDIFLVGLPYPFTGYYPGHSKKWDPSIWTWLVIKCRNRNTGGVVKLRSTDPRDMPDITFNYFEEGNDAAGDDLQALLEGVKLARKCLADPRAAQHIEAELFPGPQFQTDEQLKDYIRDQSWGHHASCTAAIGADANPFAVLDSKFRVRGVENLRVVDASVFPRLPGYFPVTAVYMISEKASDVIVERAKSSGGSPMNPALDDMINAYSGAPPKGAAGQGGGVVNSSGPISNMAGKGKRSITWGTNTMIRNRKLLNSVYNAQEAREAILGGARIVDCEDPRSALGNIKPREIMDIADAALDFKRGLDLQLSTNIGEDQLLFDRAEDGRAIEKSPYEIAGKAAQAAIGVATSMGTKLHPVNIVKVGLDGMGVDVLKEVLKEVVVTLDRTEEYSHSQVMSVLFVQDIGTWKERRSLEEVIKPLIEVREFQPTGANEDGAVDLIKYASGILDRNGNRYFADGEAITLDTLIAKNLLPPGSTNTKIRLNNPFPHPTFFPGLAGNADERTNRAVIKAMVDATVDSGANSIMLDTSILSKVARICLVDTAGSDMVDLNRFDKSASGLVTKGILPLDDIRFFVDYCHYRGIAMNLAGSVTSYQAQQIWVLIPEVDQISARGSASGLAVNPANPGAVGGGDRHQRVIKRTLVRGVAPPEQGGVLNIPEAWSKDDEAMKAVKQAAEMIQQKRAEQQLPDLECFLVDKIGNARPWAP